MAFGPQTLLVQDLANGFAMVETVEELVRQNLTTLILTSPGERVMAPQYGVGLNKYLFENMGTNVYSNIEQEIKKQAGQYMPGVIIGNIRFFTNENSNSINLQVFYSVPTLGISSTISFVENQGNGFSTY